MKIILCKDNKTIEFERSKWNEAPTIIVYGNETYNYTGRNEKEEFEYDYVPDYMIAQVE